MSAEYPIRKQFTVFGVLLYAIDFVKHTNRLFENDRVFVPGKADRLIEIIRNAAYQVYFKCYQANDLSLKIPEERQKRLKLQKEAIATCENVLFPAIDLCKHQFHIRTQSAIYWGNSTVELTCRIKSWIKADEKAVNHTDVG